MVITMAKERMVDWMDMADSSIKCSRREWGLEGRSGTNICSRACDGCINGRRGASRVGDVPTCRSRSRGRGRRCLLLSEWGRRHFATCPTWTSSESSSTVSVSRTGSVITVGRRTMWVIPWLSRLLNRCRLRRWHVWLLLLVIRLRDRGRRRWRTLIWDRGRNNNRCWSRSYGLHVGWWRGTGSLIWVVFTVILSITDPDSWDANSVVALEVTLGTFCILKCKKEGKRIR